MVGTEIVTEIEIKTSAWVDVEVLVTHKVKFYSHGSIVLRFTNLSMFGQEFLSLNPGDTKELNVLEDGSNMYYVYQLAPAFSSAQCDPLKTQTVRLSIRSNSNPSGPIITP